MDILAPATPRLDRDAMIAWYRRNRARSARLFDSSNRRAFEERPDPAAPPFIFYEGHIPAFSYLTFNERALGEAPVDARYEKLFERGIDPGSLDDAQRHARNDWPSRAEVAQFGLACDERVLAALATAKLEDPSVPRLVRGRSDLHDSRARADAPRDADLHHPPTRRVALRCASPKNTATAFHRLRVYRHSGRHRDARRYRATRFLSAGTTSSGAAPSTSHASSISKYPVTNGDWLAFVADGGPVADLLGRTRRRVVSARRLRRASASAFVAGLRDAPTSRSLRGVGGKAAADRSRISSRCVRDARRPRARVSVGRRGAQRRVRQLRLCAFRSRTGRRASRRRERLGRRDLIGNGWEWTSTPFGPFPGFEPMASYPQYSADFFDGKHYVMKGASPVTARELDPPFVPQLVLRRLSVHVRKVPVRLLA